MEDDHRALRSGFEVGEIASKVETILGLVVVPVLPHVLKPGVLEDEAVIAPSGITVVSHSQT